MTRPLPDPTTHAPQTATQQHPKGSDHDDHRDAKDGRPTHDGGATGTRTADGDRADREDGGDQSDSDRPRRTRQGATVGQPERAGDAPEPSATSRPADRPTVALTATPDGALWVAVDGADIQELAARITAACDALYRTRSAR